MLMAATIQAMVIFWFAALSGAAMAQSAPDHRMASIRITGRVMDPKGLPVPVSVRMARIVPGGLADEKIALADRQGVFTFHVEPGPTYRIYLTEYGVRTRKTVETAGRKDVDVGDVLFERCPTEDPATKLPTPPELADYLRPSQIIVEQQKSEYDLWRGILAPLPFTTDRGSHETVELPPCWSGPWLSRRGEWEALCLISFDHDVSIGAFVGGDVKYVRVVHYDPKLTTLQIQDEVQKMWRSVFRDGACAIMWSEGNRWNIEAAIEYEDGKRSLIFTDGGAHVQVQDRDGKYWYIRRIPPFNQGLAR